MEKVILVTGASSGMGKESALKLIEDGHTVYGAARRVEKMKELVEKGGYAMKMDVMDSESVESTVKQIIAEHGRIDVLWNNAGYAVYGAVEDVELDDARKQFEVNLFGVATVTKAVLPFMRKQRSGRIINTSSMGGKMYTPLGAWYHATKHALEGWSDSLRLELKQFNIDVVILEPGIIRTEFAEVMYDPMVERAKNSPYKELTDRVAKASIENYSEEKASPPSVIAELISEIVSADKVRTRYVKGKLAKPLMLARKYLGDRIFDWAVMLQAK